MQNKIMKYLTFAAISKGVLTNISVKCFILAIGYERAVPNCENSGSKTPANLNIFTILAFI